jgi:hypothetical protein
MHMLTRLRLTQRTGVACLRLAEWGVSGWGPRRIAWCLLIHADVSPSLFKTIGCDAQYDRMQS